MTADQDRGASDSTKDSSGGGLRSLQDPYERYSRLAPALVTILPIGVAFVALPTGDQDWLKPIIGVIAAGGGTLLLAAIARSAGRAVQDTIFTDGLPTLQQLRHRGTTTRAELAELHGVVTDATAVEMPTAEAEAAGPDEADGVYRIAVKKLIAATRDQSSFELLHKENRNYGFIRNLFGLRGIGRFLASVGTGAGSVLLIVAVSRGESLDVGLAIATIVIGLIAGYVFFRWLTPERVVIPATAYADRLFEAARTLG